MSILPTNLPTKTVDPYHFSKINIGEKLGNGLKKAVGTASRFQSFLDAQTPPEAPVKPQLALGPGATRTPLGAGATKKALPSSTTFPKGSRGFQAGRMNPNPFNQPFEPDATGRKPIGMGKPGAAIKPGQAIGTNSNAGKPDYPTAKPTSKPGAKPRTPATPHSVLKLKDGASREQVKTAFKNLSRQYHPDLAKNPADAARRTKKYAEITKAYSALTPKRR